MKFSVQGKRLHSVTRQFSADHIKHKTRVCRPQRVSSNLQNNGTIFSAALVSKEQRLPEILEYLLWKCKICGCGGYSIPDVSEAKAFDKASQETLLTALICLDLNGNKINPSQSRLNDSKQNLVFGSTSSFHTQLTGILYASMLVHFLPNIFITAPEKVKGLLTKNGMVIKKK